MALATVFASLFHKGTNSTYFVRASVVHKITFLPLSEVSNGPDKSAFTLWFGSVGCRSDVSRVDGRQSTLQCIWHQWQDSRWTEMSSIHARPVVALKEVLLCFVDAIMPNKQIPMSFGEDF